jgi:hypothetical protein
MAIVEFKVMMLECFNRGLSIADRARESLVTANEVEKTLAILERVAGGYALGSEENDAIKLVAEVMLFLFQTETRQDFVKFMSERDRPLTETERIHLRAIGIDPDTFKELEDGRTG